jgi:hypothetical protein
VSDHDEREDYDDERWNRPLAPDHVVRLPATVMWAFGLLQLIFAQLILAFLITIKVFADFVDGDQTVAGFWAEFRGEPAYWLVPVGWLLATVWTVLVMRTANNMRRYRRYWAAVAATIMTMCSVPFMYLAVIQFPVGVWILAVLARSDVRARFESVARGTIPSAPPEEPDARANRSAGA